MRILLPLLLAWIAKSKPCLQDSSILQSHNGNCQVLEELGGFGYNANH
jgi:hypothetical protein